MVASVLTCILIDTSVAAAIAVGAEKQEALKAQKRASRRTDLSLRTATTLIIIGTSNMARSNQVRVAHLRRDRRMSRQGATVQLVAVMVLRRLTFPPQLCKLLAKLNNLTTPRHPKSQA